MVFRISETLRKNRPTILEQWRRQVLADPAIPNADTLPRPLLLDHIPEFFDALVASLEKTEASPLDVARCHAQLRGAIGYRVQEAVKELAHLRVAILAECPLSERGALAQLNASIDQAMVEASGEIARIQAEEVAARRHSEEQLGLIIDAVKDYAIFTIDLHGTILTWNSGVERVLGYSGEEFIGQSAAMLFTPEDLAHQAPAREMKQALETGRASDIRWHVRKDGKRIFVDGVVDLMRGPSGEPIGFVKIMRDATGRKQAEDEQQRLNQAIEFERARLVTLIEQMPAGVVMVQAPTGRITLFNQRAVEILGVTAENETLSMESKGYPHGAIFPADGQPLYKALRHGIQTNREEVKYQRPDGMETTLLVNAAPILDRRGEIVAAVCVFFDIAERIEAENALRTSESRFRAIFEQAAVGIGILSLDHKWLRVNPRLCEILGYSAKELSKLTFTDITHPADVEASLDYRARLDDSGAPRFIEKRYVRKNGEPVWTRVTASLVHKASGEPDYWISIIEDITAQKHLSEELETSREAAVAASIAKSQFLANMSHEIRTPLGAILGFSELLKEPDLSQTDKIDYIDIICRNGKHLASLIDDILDLSKVEAGHLEVEMLRVSLPRLVDDVVASLGARASEKGLDFKIAIEPQAAGVIETDPTRLKQILVNILGNAIKFTTVGGVHMGVRLVERGNLLEFKVKDTGRGVAPAERDRLFLPFSQANPSTTRTFGGTGLGLMLSRKLARLLGGDVQLTESAPGKGSTFVVTIAPGTFEDGLTVNPNAGEGGRPRPIKALAGLNILVAEDSPDNQLLIERILRGSGASVTMVDNGADAVEEALVGDYAVVLLDIQMPILDGYDTVKALRDAGFERPVIALTAHAMREQREQSLRSGFNDHVTKPISFQQLLSAVARHAGRK